MKRKITLAVIGLALAVAAGGFALADPGADGPDDVAGNVDVPDHKGYEPGPPDENEPAAGAEAGFIGLTKKAALALANEQDRPWRIAREDGKWFAHDAQLVAGRATFEIDAGIVTSASIERDVPLPPDNWGPADLDRLAIIVAGLTRLVTVDNTFGGGNVFVDVRVADTIGGNPERALHPLELEMVAEALQDTGATVTFVGNADAEIDALFGESPSRLAVLAVDDVRIAADSAELELRMWCGSLCGTFLTYEMGAGDEGWHVVGPTGPIAIS